MNNTTRERFEETFSNVWFIPENKERILSFIETEIANARREERERKKILYMMTPKVKELYDRATKDEIFLQAILEADWDKKPWFFADEIDKILFSTMYYWWLVGRYENNWKI